MNPTKKPWPTDAQMLKANDKYFKANWMERDPKGSMSHAYYHGQKDLIDDLRTRLKPKDPSLLIDALKWIESPADFNNNGIIKNGYACSAKAREALKKWSEE